MVAGVLVPESVAGSESVFVESSTPVFAGKEKAFGVLSLGSQKAK